MFRFTIPSAAMVLALAGTSFGQSKMDHTSQPSDGKIAYGAQYGQRVFVKGSKMTGMNVHNAEDKDLGNIEDLLIDRGTGQIKHIVLKTGAVLGMGGRLITVPYQTLKWDSADKHVLLNATPEQLKSWPEYDKSKWAEGAKAEGSYIRTLGKDYYDGTNSPWPVTIKSDETKRDSVRGTIKSYSRQNVGNGREEIVVVVSTPNAPDRQVVLGPSWYVAGNNTLAIYRDQPVEMDVVHVDRDGRELTLAHSAKSNGNTMSYYDSQGRAAWSPKGTQQTENDAFSWSPFVLQSELKGKNLTCRSDKCGEIDDTVIECMSGRVEFLAIDPDKNFMGLGDTTRLVPWGVMTSSGKGQVYLDVNKSMMTSATALPSDLKDLSSGDTYSQAFRPFGVSPTSTETNRR